MLIHNKNVFVFKRDFITDFLLASGFIFLLSNVLAGPIRYYLFSFGLTWFIYLPKFLLFLSILTAFLKKLFKQRLSKSLILIFLLLFFSFLIAILNIGNILQIIFGLWILTPVIYGILIGLVVIYNLDNFRIYILLLWVIATAGIFLNLFYKWPWIGFNYEIANIVVEGTRKWFTGGFERLPGFARISAAAAGQILLLGLLLIFSYKNLPFRIFIWLTTGIAVFLTTTKTTIGIWLFLTFLFIFSKIFSLKFFRLLPFLLSLIVILLPFSTVFFKYRLNIQDFYTHLLLASFEERLTFTWPWTISMILNFGSVILGRGIGGIGTPQIYFESQLYSPADNVALYLFGLFGMVGLIMLIIIGLLVTLKLNNTKQGKLIFYLSIACFLEGLSLSVIEEPFFATCLGVIFGTAFYRYRRIEFQKCKNVLRETYK